MKKKLFFSCFNKSGCFFHFNTYIRAVPFRNQELQIRNVEIQGGNISRGFPFALFQHVLISQHHIDKIRQ